MRLCVVWCVCVELGLMGTHEALRGVWSADDPVSHIQICVYVCLCAHACECGVCVDNLT
jgi:hypothetical protein